MTFGTNKPYSKLGLRAEIISSQRCLKEINLFKDFEPKQTGGTKKIDKTTNENSIYKSHKYGMYKQRKCCFALMKKQNVHYDQK